MNIVELLDMCKDGLSRRKFAAQIGLSPSMLTFLYNGTKKMGNKTLSCLVSRYPQYREQILSVFLSQNVDYRNDIRPDKTSKAQKWEDQNSIGQATAEFGYHNNNTCQAGQEQSRRIE